LIPRTVHQTWRDADIPEPLRSHAETWRRLHPDWSYRLWTDADLAELVEGRYPDLAPIFHAYAKPIMRADLGRYLVLKSFGGIYADLDAEALRPWDEVLAATRPVLFEEPATHAAE
jgi:mannosyltransferase OCH1-like enzyme